MVYRDREAGTKMSGIGLGIHSRTRWLMLLMLCKGKAENCQH